MWGNKEGGEEEMNDEGGGREMDIGDVPKERMEDRKGGERRSERMGGGGLLRRGLMTAALV